MRERERDLRRRRRVKKFEKWTKWKLLVCGNKIWVEKENENLLFVKIGRNQNIRCESSGLPVGSMSRCWWFQASSLCFLFTPANNSLNVYLKSGVYCKRKMKKVKKRSILKNPNRISGPSRSNIKFCFIVTGIK